MSLKKSPSRLSSSSSSCTPPKRRQRLLGAAATAKPDLGVGLTPEGLSRLQVHLSAWREQTEHQQRTILLAWCSPKPLRIPAGNSSPVLDVLMASSGYFQSFLAHGLFKLSAPLVEGGVQTRPDQMQPSSTKNVPHGALPPSISSLLPSCTAALPPK